MRRRSTAAPGERTPVVLLATAAGAVALMVICLVSSLVRAHSADAEAGMPSADSRASYVAGHGKAVLTFDDGPDPTWTPRVLDVLRRTHTHAVFFLVGEAARRYPDLVRQIAADGNVIGNHTYTHADPVRISTAELAAEIDRANEVLRQLTGTRPMLFRPPYGHPTPQLEGLLARRSMRTVLWDNSPSDYEVPTASQITQRVLQTANPGPGTIVLLHDGDAGGADDDRMQTCRALEPMIAGLRARGFDMTVEVPPRSAG